MFNWEIILGLGFGIRKVENTEKFNKLENLITEVASYIGLASAIISLGAWLLVYDGLVKPFLVIAILSIIISCVRIKISVENGECNC